MINKIINNPFAALCFFLICSILYSVIFFIILIISPKATQYSQLFLILIFFSSAAIFVKKLSIRMIIRHFVLILYLIHVALIIIQIGFFMPYGGGDSWVIWNLKAKFIFENNGTVWRTMLDEQKIWWHSDYPLFIPIITANFWKIFHRSSVYVPIFIAAVVTLCVLCFLYKAIFDLSKSRLRAFMAVFILGGTPFFLTHGMSQYADIPLSLFFLLNLYFLFNITRYNLYSSILIGLTASLPAWVKNEGLYWFAIVFLLFIIKSKNIRPIILFLMGALPVLITIFILRLQINYQNDLIGTNLREQISQIFNFSRHQTIIRAFLKSLAGFGEWKISLWPAWLLYLYLIFKKIGNRVIFMLLPLLMLGAYYFTYLITPRDLVWHLDTSLNRLILQLWPPTIFIIFIQSVKNNNSNI